ncbi:MAG: cadmium-translocating P-type ATPase [Chloroflexi bacterium]|nr:cadmium-translocating P-type ATPase [Chloroflexota bacterium]
MKTVEIAITLPAGGQCDGCLERLRSSVGLIKGVEEVVVKSQACSLTLDYDPDLASLSRIEEAAKDIGAGIDRRYAHETISITDMDCADCAAKLEAAIGRLPGVVSAGVNFASALLNVEYERERVERAQIVGVIRGLGYGVAEEARAIGETTSEFGLTGMDCADCAVTIERNLASVGGVAEAKVNFAAATLKVRHAPSLTPEQLARVVEASGYGARPLRSREAGRERSFWLRNRRAVLTVGSGIALALGFALDLLGAPDLFSTIPISNALFALAMALGGYHIARSGLYGLLKSRTMDMNVLMTIAVVGAGAIGEWFEGAMVVFLFSLGNTLEGYTMDRARGAIRALMALAPTEARVRRNGAEVTVAAEDVDVGEVVLARPGEKVPVDGRVVAGASAVNQAPITGESMPVDKEVGDEVFAGSLVEQGYLEVKATKPYAENTISHIVHLVEEAQAQRAPSQRFVDRFATYYTPAVIVGAVAVATVPWLLFAQPFETWFYRALVLLVIACPCALVISTPVSIVSGIARAAGLGVLIKGGAYLEEMGGLRAVAFDKTGTLTAGRPEVTDVVPLNGLPEDELLHLAAAVEGRSEHPLAAAVLRRANGNGRNGAQKISLEHTHAISDFEAVTGKGVRAVLDGATYYVGSLRLFQELDVPVADVAARVSALQEDGKTVLLVGTDEGLLGLIAVADRLRPVASEAVASLRRAGVEHVVLLTGDHEGTARAIARAVGADEYRAGLLPEDKVAAIRDLRRRYGKVGMVGDGVNDAPALAAASVGIAMGAAGTDAALEAADVALMADDLSKPAVAIGLSRRSLTTIRQNITFALLAKAVFLALAVPGLATLWLAILADTGASVLVTLNGMRLLRYGAPSGAAARADSPHAHEQDEHGGGHDHGQAHGHEHGMSHEHAHEGRR